MPNSSKDDSSRDDSSKPCLLTTVYQKNEAAMLGALLEDSGIPYFIKERGNGGYLKIYMGYTIFGEEIYVNENQYEQAKELVDLYFSHNEDILDEGNLDDDNLNEYTLYDNNLTVDNSNKDILNKDILYEDNLTEDNLTVDNSNKGNLNKDTLYDENLPDDNLNGNNTNKIQESMKNKEENQEDLNDNTSQVTFMRKCVVWVARSILLTMIIALIGYFYRILNYIFNS